MAGLLRALGLVVMLLGLAAAAIAGWLLVGDADFADAAAAYARHPEHAMFRTEYWVAAARHYGLMAATAAGLLLGLAGGSVLLALGELLRASRGASRSRL
jgi:hypothetical protein